MFFSASKQKNNFGFTLIELLVVISIISLLSSVVLSSLSSARMKARDVRRIQDLKQIQIALEMYRNDFGKYPNSFTIGCTGSSGAGDWCTSYHPTWNSKFGDTLKNYISKLPIDPINNGNNPFDNTNEYSYNYLSGRTGNCADGSCYDLVTNLEETSSPYICVIKKYFRKTDGLEWCGQWSRQIYSPQN